ncbi:hypothetical protein BET03_09355 [Thermohalobacter berrensis]|uniref:Diguanylate cyclase n=1 Tax=Thermohalobacter berrensis TaxID=99594 RepID=A0A419T7T8_9FIRM|nr:hypothetical protein BET03_09355 [Thermohalobacter berrensis]
MLQNTGYSKTEVTGISIAKFVHPDDKKRVIESHQKRIAGVETEKMYSVRVIKKDGNIMWVSINSARIEWEGKPAVLSFLHDITEAKILEEKVKQNEQFFRAVFEQSPSGIFMFDNNYIVTQCNNRLAQILNSSIEKIVGLNLKRLKYKEVIPYFDRALNGEEVIYEGPYYSTTGDSKIWIFIRIFPIKDEKDNIISGVGIVEDFTGFKETQKALTESKQRFSQIINFLPDPTFAIDKNGKVIMWNKEMEEITGIKSEEMLGKDNYEYALPFYGKKRPILINLVLNSKEDIEDNYISFQRTTQNTLIGESYSPKLDIYLWGKARPLYGVNGNIVGAIESIRDITTIKDTERKLTYQKKCFEALFKNSTDAIVFFDTNHRVIDINSRFTELFGYTSEECIGKDVDRLVANKENYLEARKLTETVFKGNMVETQSVRYNKEGKPIDVRIKSVLVVVNGEVVGGYGIYSDIREQKKYERKLKILSIHDQLTGLYNRTYYEQIIENLSHSNQFPITIVSTDMDGLKLVNDTLGHSKGDEILKNYAKVLKRSVRQSDILARIGGDEFVIILPYTDEESGEKVLKRIRENIKDYNKKHPRLQLHISMGIATASNKGVSILETYKKADDLMYRDKLQRRKSARSQIISTLMAALTERDYITSGHVKRVKKLSIILGEKLNLSSKQLSDLTLLAEFHDLGKVGIPDKILFKEGPLTEEEWEIMRQHPEKGYRIAMSSPDLSGVADLILKHHERWDGNGYPLGLKGLEIPIECRILSIVDAYDAMTSERPYSRKKSKEEAIEELKRCSGSQFDPKLVKIFLDIIGDNN